MEEMGLKYNRKRHMKAQGPVTEKDLIAQTHIRLLLHGL